MTPVHLPGVPAPEFPAVWTGIPRRAAGYTAAQLREYATEAVMAERVQTAAAIEVIAKEMREHLVNNGKHTSPPLVAWAKRLTKITQSETNSER